MIQAILQQHGLTLMIAAPLIGAMGLLCNSGRIWTLLMCLLGAGSSLLMGVFVLVNLRHIGGLEFSDHISWIPQMGISYWIAVDGLSYYLLLMTVLAIPVLLYLESNYRAGWRRRAFFLMILEAALLCSYAALDLILFLFCLEIATISLFLYIGDKERAGNRILGVRFLLLNLIGSGLLLMVVMVIYQAGGGTSHLANLLQEPMAPARQILWCGIFIAAITIKGALIPWHAWFRGLEKRLDPGILIAVNGLYLPLAGYAVIRFVYVLLPYGFLEWRSSLLTLALLSFLLACLGAWAARDKRSIISYLSLAIAAWIIVGVCTLTSDGLKGSLYLMGQHTWIMVLFAAVVAAQSSSSPLVKRWIYLLASIACLLIIAVPGSSVFIAMFLIARAAYGVQPLWIMVSLMLWMSVGGLLIRHHGCLSELVSPPGATRRAGMVGVAFLFALLIVWGGIHPGPVTSMMQRDGDAWLARIDSARQFRFKTPEKTLEATRP